MKLIESSSVLRDSPSSPKFSTVNCFCLAMDVISSTFSSTGYVGVMENVRFPLFLPQSSSSIRSSFGFSSFVPEPQTEHSSTLETLVKLKIKFSRSTCKTLSLRLGSFPVIIFTASETSMPPIIESIDGCTPSMLQVGIESSSSAGNKQ